MSANGYQWELSKQDHRYHYSIMQSQVELRAMQVWPPASETQGLEASKVLRPAVWVNRLTGVTVGTSLGLGSQS